MFVCRVDHEAESLIRLWHGLDTVFNGSDIKDKWCVDSHEKNLFLCVAPWRKLIARFVPSVLPVRAFFFCAWKRVRHSAKWQEKQMLCTRVGSYEILSILTYWNSVFSSLKLILPSESLCSTMLFFSSCYSHGVITSVGLFTYVHLSNQHHVDGIFSTMHNVTRGSRLETALLCIPG